MTSRAQGQGTRGERAWRVQGRRRQRWQVLEAGDWKQRLRQGCAWELGLGRVLWPAPAAWASAGLKHRWGERLRLRPEGGPAPPSLRLLSGGHLGPTHTPSHRREQPQAPSTSAWKACSPRLSSDALGPAWDPRPGECCLSPVCLLAWQLPGAGPGAPGVPSPRGGQQHPGPPPPPPRRPLARPRHRFSTSLQSMWHPEARRSAGGGGGPRGPPHATNPAPTTPLSIAQ